MSWKIKDVTLPLNPRRVIEKSIAELKAAPQPIGLPMLIHLGPKSRVLSLEGMLAEAGKTASDLETDYLVPLRNTVVRNPASPRLFRDDDLTEYFTCEGVHNITNINSADDLTDWSNPSANLTLSIDTTDYKEGTGCVRGDAATASGNTTYDIQYNPTGTWDWSIRTHICLYLKYVLNETPAALRVYVYDSAGNFMYWDVPLPGSNVWTARLHLAFESPTGTSETAPDLSSADRVRVALLTALTVTGSVVLKVDDLDVDTCRVTSLVYEDVTDPVAKGKNSVRVSELVGTSGSWGRFRLIKYFSPNIDLSRQDFFSFWLYGGNYGNPFRILFLTPTWADGYRYDLTDNFTGWKRFIIRKDEFSKFGDNPDWSNVSRLIIYNIGWNIGGTWYFDRFCMGTGILLQAPDTRYDGIYVPKSFTYNELGGRVSAFEYTLELWCTDDYY